MAKDNNTELNLIDKNITNIATTGASTSMAVYNGFLIFEASNCKNFPKLL
jgi:hypothetical protein